MEGANEMEGDCKRQKKREEGNENEERLGSEE